MRNLVLIVITLFITSPVVGKTLFSYKKGAIKPLLAIKVKKIQDGKYEIDIDTNKKIQGKNMTPEFVKNSLEGKLKKSLKVAVAKVDDDTVHITFEGKEETFLKRVSKTRIKARKSVSLALESGVSDAGIRAKTGKEPPADDEIKVKVLKISDSEVEGIIVGVGKKYKGQLKMGRKIKMKTQGPTDHKKGKNSFFKPEKKQDRWILP